MKESPGRLERIINHIELIKKVLVSLLLIVLSFTLLIFLLRNSFKKQLIIKPFKISTSLEIEGYTGEVLTTLFIDKIKEMQQIGASFYHKDKVILPSWDNEVDGINVAFNNSIFSDVKSMFEYFGSKSSQYGNGQIIKVDNMYVMQFSINNHSITILNKQTLNDLLSSAAEFTLNPNIASYQIK